MYRIHRVHIIKKNNKISPLLNETFSSIKSSKKAFAEKEYNYSKEDVAFLVNENESISDKHAILRTLCKTVSYLAMSIADSMKMDKSMNIGKISNMYLTDLKEQFQLKLIIDNSDETIIHITAIFEGKYIVFDYNTPIKTPIKTMNDMYIVLYDFLLSEVDLIKTSLVEISKGNLSVKIVDIDSEDDVIDQWKTNFCKMKFGLG